MKDGLIPLTEWLGKSPWSTRMLEMLDDLPGVLDLEKPITGDWFGNSATVEVHGDLMQVLARMYWFTNNSSYLDQAIHMPDFYLQDDRLPTEKNRLRIRSFGLERLQPRRASYCIVPVPKNGKAGFVFLPPSIGIG